jgi:hypothetical protein
VIHRAQIPATSLVLSKKQVKESTELDKIGGTGFHFLNLPNIVWLLGIAPASRCLSSSRAQTQSKVQQKAAAKLATEHIRIQLERFEQAIYLQQICGGRDRWRARAQLRSETLPPHSPAPLAPASLACSRVLTSTAGCREGSRRRRGWLRGRSPRRGDAGGRGGEEWERGGGVVVGRFCVLLVLGVGRPSGALLFSDFYFILWFPSRPADGRKQQRAGKARFAWVPFLLPASARVSPRRRRNQWRIVHLAGESVGRVDRASLAKLAGR